LYIPEPLEFSEILVIPPKSVLTLYLKHIVLAVLATVEVGVGSFTVAVGVGVLTGFVKVATGVLVGVLLGVGVFVRVLVGVGVLVLVSVEVGVGSFTLAVGVGVLTGFVYVATGVLVGVLVGLGVGGTSGSTNTIHPFDSSTLTAANPIALGGAGGI